DAPRIATANLHTAVERRQFLRRTNKGRNRMAVLERLAKQRAPGAPVRAKNQQSHWMSPFRVSTPRRPATRPFRYRPQLGRRWRQMGHLRGFGDDVDRLDAAVPRIDREHRKRPPVVVTDDAGTAVDVDEPLQHAK